MGACMGTCMGVVSIAIPYKHIAILQFMMFAQHQVAEKLNEERLFGFNTL